MSRPAGRAFGAVCAALALALLASCGGGGDGDAGDTPGRAAEIEAPEEEAPEAFDRAQLLDCLVGAGLEVVDNSDILISSAEALAVPGDGILGLGKNGSAAAVVFVYSSEGEAGGAADTLLDFIGPQAVVSARANAVVEYTEADAGTRAAIDGCVPEAGPAAAPGQEGSDAEAAAEETAAPSPAAVSYDGSWAGTTSKGDAMSFVVSGGQVASFKIDFTLRGAICSVGTKLKLSGLAEPTTNGAFAIESAPLSGVGKQEIGGTFTSPTSAEGVIHFAGDDLVCGRYGYKASWTAGI